MNVDGKPLRCLPSLGGPTSDNASGSVYLAQAVKARSNAIAEHSKRPIVGLLSMESRGELVTRASPQPFKDGEIDRTPGDRWTVVGPCEYVPPVEVEIMKSYSAIPLDETGEYCSP